MIEEGVTLQMDVTDPCRKGSSVIEGTVAVAAINYLSSGEKKKGGGHLSP